MEDFKNPSHSSPKKPDKNSLFDILSKNKNNMRITDYKEGEQNFNLSLTTKNHSKSLFPLKQSKKPIKWSEQDSRTFFKCLEIFGMDFSMIKEVLSHKTQRQILRKFHKEKKRNPEAIELALKIHESNLIQKDQACQNFLDKIFKHSSNSDFISDNFSDDSLDKAVIKKLKIMFEDSKDGKEMKEENQLQPLDYYLRE